MMLLFPLALKKESCKVGQTCSTLLKLSSDAPLIQNHVTTTQQEEIVKAVGATIYYSCTCLNFMVVSWDIGLGLFFCRFCKLRFFLCSSFPPLLSATFNMTLISWKGCDFLQLAKLLEFVLLWRL